jgi:hypothetical protein
LLSHKTAVNGESGASGWRGMRLGYGGVDTVTEHLSFDLLVMVVAIVDLCILVMLDQSE